MKQVQFYCLFFCAFFGASQLFAQTANVNEGCSPLEVQFTAAAGLSTYFWDFGNNGTSVLANPTRVFNSPGTYEVSLRETVEGALVGTVTVTVFMKPEVAIAADPAAGCAPLIANFTNQSTLDPSVAYTSLWSFGALGTSTDASPTWTFSDIGTTNIGLTVESDLPNCTATGFFGDFIEVSEKPEVSFTTNPSPAGACEGPLDVNFVVTSDPDLSYVWDFDNGETFSGLNPPTQTYTAEGIYFVTLTGTNAVNCSVTTNTAISIGLPAVAFSVPEINCVGTSVPFQNQSANGNYTWDFGDGGMSTEASPNHAYTAPGMYEVSLTVETSEGCINSQTQTVTVGIVDASFEADPTYTCNGEIIVTYTPTNLDQDSYEWLLADSTTSTDVVVVDTIYGYDTMIYSINEIIEFNTSLTVTSPEGCTATQDTIIIMDRPNAEFVPDTISGCAPLTVTFEDLSVSNVTLVEWIYDLDFNGETVSNTTGEDIAYTFTAAGEYDVTLITVNEFDCRDTSYAIQILVGAPIEDLNFQADQTTICIGDTINFEGISGSPNIDAWHFETDGGRSHHCFQDPTMAWVFQSETGTLDVSLTAEYNGCLSTEIKENYITINGPLARLSYEMDCSTTNTVQFRDSSLDATSVLWDFGDESTSTELNPVHDYPAVGDYNVILTVMDEATGCPASLDSTTICIRNMEAKFELDTLLCVGKVYALDASPSTDVDARCFRGFTWDIPNQDRPITTDEEAIEFIFGTPGDDVVNLYTRDINGCKDTMSLDVRVFEIRPDFTFDPAPICYPTEVNFTDATQADTTIMTWEWDFGDGTMGEGQEVSHLFNQAAATVTLTTTDVLGCDGSTTLTVPDYFPFSVITATPSVLCVGDDVSFSATDFTQQGSNLTFDWNFGNGMTSMNQTETITYNEPGIYEVSLFFQEIATGCGGESTTTILVEGYPEAGISSNLDGVDPICAPLIASFQSTTQTTSPTLYTWNLGDGNTAVGETAGNNYDAGTYTITLNAITAQAGCADSETYTFTALEGPSGDFEIDPGSICNGEAVTFTLTDSMNISSFSFDFGDGETSTDVSPISHTYNLPQGEASVSPSLTLTSIDGLCEVNVDKTFVVVDPMADFLWTVDCDGLVTFTNLSSSVNTYAWTFGDGNSSGNTNPTNTYTSPGTYTVSLTATDAISGCTDVTTQEITITDAVAASFTITGGSTVSCEGVFSFENTSSANADVFSWDFGNGTGSDEPNPTVTFAENGTYNVTLIATDTDTDPNCSNTFIFPVTVDLVEANFESFTVDPCTYEILFENTSVNADNYTWAFGDGNTSILADPAHTYTDFGNFEVILTATNTATGCSDMDTQTITVEETEILMDQSFPPDGEILIEGDTYVVNAPGIPSFPVTSDTMFVLQVMNACGAAIYTYDINFILDDSGLTVPNVITPNNDNINDFFNVYIPESDNLPNLEFTRFEIYNRWGQKIYDNDTPATGWDGRYNGEYVTQDVYIYIVEVGFPDTPSREPQIFQGDVTVLR